MSIGGSLAALTFLTATGSASNQQTDSPSTELLGAAPSTPPAPTLRASLDARTTALGGTGIIVAQIGPAGVSVMTSGTSGTDRPLDVHSLFEIGSVTKTFTATLLATMVLDGSVRLDDPVATYLPPTVHVPTRNGKAITLLNLATQHSGLPRLPTNLTDVELRDPYARYSIADMYAFLSDYVLPRDPGESFEYSNYGIALLGQALANRAHTSYAELLRQRVLDPLGMHDTTLALDAAQRPRFTVGRDTDNVVATPWTFDAIAPAGALHSSIDDMLKFARCNLGQGPLAAACRFAQEPRADSPDGKIGLVWLTRSDGTVHHDGATAGYYASLAIDATHTRATIALANGGLSVDDVALHTLDPNVPIMRVPASLALEPAALEAYVGTYDSAETKLAFAVTRTDDKLFVALTGQPASRIYPVEKDQFVSRIVDARFKFIRASSGAPTALVLLQNGQTIVFVRPGATPPPASEVEMFAPIITLDATTLAGYVGTYRAAIGTFTVTRDGNQLLVRLAGQPAAPVYASARDAFFYKIVNATIDFGRDAAGNVTRLTLHQNGNDIAAQRT